MSEIKNAIIKSTRLGPEDHGIFTCFLSLEGDGWGCGFGGYSLDTWSQEQEKRVGNAFGMEFISSILSVLGVERWEDLPGKYLRAETEGWGGKILRIGHPIKEVWFDPKELAEKFKETKQ